jgi:methyl-accepting chemotaxis protein
MPIPWEISAALAAAALLALGMVAALTLIEIRKASRSVMELSAAAERHLPAIRQNLEEINRSASALTSSVQTLSRKASETAEGFEGISTGIHHTVQALETDVIEPSLKAVKILSTLFAFGAVVRQIRHPLRLLLRMRMGRL